MVELAVMLFAGITAFLIGKTAVQAVRDGRLYKAGFDLIERETSPRTFWLLAGWRGLLCLAASLVSVYGLLATLGVLGLTRIEL